MSKFLTIKNEGNPEILIHGPIGRSMWSDEGVTGEDFTNALNKFPKGTKVTIGINSQGGSVGEGLAIYNAIERRADDITCRIDGYALSIASVFPQAAGRVISPKTSIWMIHRASMWSQGNASQLRKDADLLDKHDDVICTAYCVSTGKAEAEVKQAMDQETWMTGDQAVAWGLADESSDEPTNFAAIDLSKFKGCPENVKTILAAATNADPPKGLSQVIVVTAQSQRPPTVAAASISATVADDTGNAAGNNQRKTKMDTATTAAVNPPANNELDLIRNQLASERRKRIKAEVIKLAENRIPNDQLDGWVDRAVTDEEWTLNAIRSLPVNVPGGEPVGRITEGRSDPYQEIKKLPTASARYDAMRRDWNELYADAERRGRGQPMNLNTFTSTLTTAFLIDGSVTKLQNRWALLKAYTTDFSTDTYKPISVGHLKFVTVGATGQTNPTNWESGDSTVTDCTITPANYAQSFQISQADLNKGLRMENIIDINSAVFADTITSVATAPITVANYETGGGQTSLVRSATNFNFSDMATLWGQLKKSGVKNVLLDGEYLARIINTPTLFQMTGTDQGGGWKNFGWDGIYLCTNWTGADTNVRGFACAPQAIGAIAGLPVVPPSVPGNTLQQSVATVPDVQISYLASSWFSLATRTFWMSFDIMFGAAVLDNTAGVLVKSA